MNTRDIYQTVTGRIVAAIEAGGVAPWHKPWRSSGGESYPVSLSTGKRYRGINVLLLMLENFDDPRWGTFKAIKDAGGHVRKGEKGTRIILWKPTHTRERENEQGEMERGKYLLLRDYCVFNAAQADGLPDLPSDEETQPFTPLERAEAIMKQYVWGYGTDTLGPSVMYGYNRACYDMARDSVSMPNPEQFDDQESYYCTLYHELVHSTGHESRLKRLEPALFGTDPYAREELVAEIGASFLAGVAGFEKAGGDQSAAYVGNWLEKLKGDAKFVVQAAAAAQKAADLILGTTFDNESKEEEQQAVAV